MTKRSSNIELLRIIAMIMIILSHATQYMSGGTFWNQIVEEPFSWNLCFSMLAGGGGQIAVIVFVAITSFYQCDSRSKTNLYSLVLIIVDTMMLNMILRVSYLAISRTITSKGVLQCIWKALTSPISGEYWFITAFVFFDLLIPLLRIGVNQLEENKLRNICVILTIVLLCSDFLYLRFAGAVVDFIYIFILISYLKTYKYEWMNHHCTKLLIASGIILVILTLGVKFVSSTTGVLLLGKCITHFFVNWNPILVSFAVSLFWKFLNMKIKSSQVINKIATSVFGIYLVHENHIMSGDNSLLWCQISNLNDAFYTPEFPIVLLLDSFIVFLLAMIIVFMYKSVMKAIFGLTKIENTIENIQI